jgi:alpha-mannosidase
VIDRWDVHPEMLLSQSLGEHEFRYAIFPHAGRWAEANVPREADAFTLPLEAAQAGKHGGDLPRTLSLLRVEPETLALSALKRAEERQSVIVRLYNPTEEQVAARITTYRPIKEAYSCNMNEDRREALTPRGNSLALTAGKKQILTVELVF